MRVAIIGAGASGLPSARHAVLYGFEPVVFESTGDIGGLWNYKTEDNEDASVMKSTVINSSKEMSSYSDFPPKPEEANFMHNRKLLQYFRDYANHYDLMKYIKFNHKVINITKAEDHEKTGKWKVEYTNQDSKPHSEIFDAVLVATGHHKKSTWPKPWPGQEKYKGKLLHSHSYKNSKGFEDKRVVTVGIGNSGADIAVELSRVTEQLYLSTRRGAWVFNRVHDYGYPLDAAVVSRIQEFVSRSPLMPMKLLNYLVESQLNRRFNHELYGLKPNHSIFAAHITINDDLPNRIIAGTILVKPNIDRFTETSVIFEDGTEVENVDAVIFSTGYSIEFPLVEGGKLIKVENNQVDLFKYMYPLDQKHNTLAVIGLIQPLGSIMPISEMQARVFFSALSGESKLPSKEEMRIDVNQKRAEMKARYVHSPRHTIQVNYINFMDELADMIDCRPKPLELLFTDFKLFKCVMMGPCAPYLYRLRGPHKWSGARDAICGIPDRIKQGLHPGAVPKPGKASFSIIQIFVAVSVILILRYFFAGNMWQSAI